MRMFVALVLLLLALLHLTLIPMSLSSADYVESRWIDGMRRWPADSQWMSAEINSSSPGPSPRS
ncbi:hypothetical protein AAFG13_37265 [Bradyrhizobium sp. B124]|uniref:hypothetical protein n=1 Tax=Bradyrhizobium sp. B124 TaxID=3140245 RepID=UPI0031845678